MLQPGPLRSPCVYLDYGKINTMKSQENSAAGCAVTASSRIRALLYVCLSTSKIDMGTMKDASLQT